MRKTEKTAAAAVSVSADFSSETVQYSEALDALRKRVSGYSVTETKITYTRTDKGSLVVKDKISTEKHFQPDLNAIIFVLANRAPHIWRQKPDSADYPAEQPPEVDMSRLSDSTLLELSDLK